VSYHAYSVHIQANNQAIRYQSQFKKAQKPPKAKKNYVKDEKFSQRMCIRVCDSPLPHLNLTMFSLAVEERQLTTKHTKHNKRTQNTS